MDSTGNDALVAEMRRNNDLLERLVKQQSDWRLAMRQGLVTGLASVLGATLLVSMLLWLAQPLRHLDALKPALDRIADRLEQGPRR